MVFRVLKIKWYFAKVTECGNTSLQNCYAVKKIKKYFTTSPINKKYMIAVLTGLIFCSFTIYMLLTTPHKPEFDEAFDPGSHGTDEEFHNMEDFTVAKKLHEKVRVLCWVMTHPENHRKKAKHVKATWGKRCNILLFMSSAEGKTRFVCKSISFVPRGIQLSFADPSLPTIALPVKEGRNNLWGKTKEAFKYVHNHYLNEADWFLKADDDTYVILENLRYMLMPYKPSDPIYFGRRFKTFVTQGYMSGGAGYVLSREAVKRLVEICLTNSTVCKNNEYNSGSEDVEIGKCLEAVEVKAGDSRDSLKRGRFFSFVPEDHLIPGRIAKDEWFWNYIYYEEKHGMECCSDNAVSFHYVSAGQMYVLEYLIYHLRPYGIAFHVEMPAQLLDRGSGTSFRSELSTVG